MYSDGSADKSYGIDGHSNEISMGGAHAAIQKDGKIVVAGYNFGTSNDQCGSCDPVSRDVSMIRYNTDGSLDSTFYDYYDKDENGSLSNPHDNTTTSVAIQNDGKVILKYDIVSKEPVEEIASSQDD